MSSYSRDIAQQILTMLHRHPKWSRSDIADALGDNFTEDMVTAYIDRLVAKGIFVRLGGSSDQGYWLVLEKL
jgi:predicted HTH transcriptional regulator